MRRTALAVVEAILVNNGLGEESFQRNALGHLIVNAAKNGDHVIFGCCERGERGRNGLLPGHRPEGDLETVRLQPRPDRLSNS